jgi:hypothetical protein
MVAKMGLNMESDNLFKQRLRDKGFDESQIYDILQVVETTCKICLDGNSNCQCWNDE